MRMHWKSSGYPENIRVGREEVYVVCVEEGNIRARVH
jgi:hypothetical protein